MMLNTPYETFLKIIRYQLYGLKCYPAKVRETLRWLMKHDMVDAVVATAGGIEEDFMKCFAPHLVAEFELKGEMLLRQNLNRQGNLLGTTSQMTQGT